MKIFILLVTCLLSASCANNNLENDVDLSGVNYERNEALIKQILSSNQSNILTPENSGNAFNNIPRGYSFKLVKGFDHQTNNLTDSWLVKYAGKKKNAHYFLLKETAYSYSSKSLVTGYSHFKIQNKKFYLYTKETDKYREVGLKALNCFFIVGKCQYKENFRDKKYTYKVNTTFKNGMWVSSYKNAINLKVNHLRIFDRYGLELFYVLKSNTAKNAQISVRVPLSKSDIQDLESMTLEL